MWLLNLMLLVFVGVTAVAALQTEDLLSSAAILGAFSFMMCIVYAVLGAVDVAFTEAAVGAGASTVFMIATILRTSRRTSR